MFRFSSAAAACAAAVMCILPAVSSAASVSADYIGLSDADIDGTSSSLGTHAFGMRADFSNVSLILRDTVYDFGNVETDPFDDLKKAEVLLRHNGHLATNIAYFTSLGLGVNFEEDVTLSDTYAVTPTAAVGYDFKSGITLFAGLTANLNAADNIILPVLGIKFGDDRDLGWTGSVAFPETKAQYRFSERWAADLSFVTVNDTYHIDNDGKKGEWADGFFREESYGASLGATFTPAKNIRLSCGMMTMFNRTFKVYDNNGNKISSFDTDAAFGGYLRVGYVF